VPRQVAPSIAALGLLGMAADAVLFDRRDSTGS
jgi:hypothetical protein